MDEEEARSGVAAGRQLRTRLTLLKGNTPRGRTPRAQEGGRCSLRTSAERSRPRFQPWTPLSVTAPTGGMHEHAFVERVYQVRSSGIRADHSHRRRQPHHPRWRLGLSPIASGNPWPLAAPGAVFRALSRVGASAMACTEQTKARPRPPRSRRSDPTSNLSHPTFTTALARS